MFSAPEDRKTCPFRNIPCLLDQCALFVWVDPPSSPLVINPDGTTQLDECNEPVRLPSVTLPTRRGKCGLLSTSLADSRERKE